MKIIYILLLTVLSVSNSVYAKEIDRIPVISTVAQDIGNIDYIEVTSYMPSKNITQKIFTNKGYVVKPSRSISTDDYDFSYPLRIIYNIVTGELENACLDNKCFPITSFSQVTIIKPVLCKGKS